MDEIDFAIIEIMGIDFCRPSDFVAIKSFISQTTISQFEKLKDLDWEESQKTKG